MIRNEDDTEDTDVPVDTVAAVFLDRATKWIAVYPKSSKSANTLHSSNQALCCFEIQGLAFLLRQRAIPDLCSHSVPIESFDHRHATNQRRGREVRQNGKGRQQLRNRTVGIFHQMVA